MSAGKAFCQPQKVQRAAIARVRVRDLAGLRQIVRADSCVVATRASMGTRSRPCRPRAKGRRSREFEQGDDMDQVSAAAAAAESHLETLRTAPAGEGGK